jgi:hypothetical protein
MDGTRLNHAGAGGALESHVDERHGTARGKASSFSSLLLHPFDKGRLFSFAHMVDGDSLVVAYMLTGTFLRALSSFPVGFKIAISKGL